MADLALTPIDEIPKVVESLRATFRAGVTRPIEYRKAQLRALRKLVTDELPALAAAVHQDLHKNQYETELTETSVVLSEVTLALQSLDSWTTPVKTKTDLLNSMDKCLIRYDPLGVVLIIGAWNYPVNLVLAPMVGAIAAGNCIVLKPSELASATAKLLAELVPKYLDPASYAVVNGGVAETSRLLEERFDHILYTGSSQVGKIIMTAAAKHLTPVTLELGGKSPAIILDDSDPVIAARRIAWARFSNAGQTCIAPDYILCTAQMQDKILKEIPGVLKEFYGDNIKENFGRLVNKNHLRRVASYIEESKIAIGGKVEEDDLYIAPTVLIGVDGSSPSMQQEIFGPVLPILNYKTLDEAIEFVNDREKPLVLYIFGKDQKLINRVTSQTSSGAVLANDCFVHFTIHTLPFGGVGNSGMGAYHGFYSFETFSHRKSVMLKDESLEFVNVLRYPPYSEKKMSRLRGLVNKEHANSTFSMMAELGFLGAAAASAYFM